MKFKQIKNILLIAALAAQFATALDWENPLQLPDFARWDYGGTLPTLAQLQCFADKAPALVNSQQVELENALNLAILSGAAYYDQQYVEHLAKTLGFPTINQIHVVQKKLDGKNVIYVDSSVLWLENDSDVVLAFQGTNPNKLPQLLTDSQLLQIPFQSGDLIFGLAHNGFVNNVEAVWPRIEEKLRALKIVKNIHVTGHSLGAATGILAAIKIVTLKIPNARFADVYTYGSPRVGDKQLVSYTPANTFRFVHNNDGVTRVPFTQAALDAIEKSIGSGFSSLPFFPKDLGLAKKFPEYFDAGQLLYFNADGKLFAGKDATDNVIPDLKINPLREIIDHDIRFYMEYSYRNLSGRVSSNCLNSENK